MNRISFEFTGDVKQAIDAVKKNVQGAQAIQATDSQGRSYAEDGSVTENVPQHPDPSTNPPTPQQGTATASADPQTGKTVAGPGSHAKGAAAQPAASGAAGKTTASGTKQPAGGKASR